MENKILTTNFHTHTTRCNHAAGEDRQYVEEAIKGGLKVLGFSDHSPYFFLGDYYSTFRMKREQVPGYVDSILALKKEYKDDIEIKLGFETEYYPKYFDKLLEFYSQYPIDYIIMGQHFVLNEEEHIYSGELHHEEDMMMRYVDQVIEGLETGCFTYLAHPDLLNFGGSKENYEKAADKLCAYAAKNKVPLEINMLGMREHRHYPNFEFFKIAARHNCDIILGCDAHEPKGVCDLESAKTALELCRELGLNRIEYPELKKPCRK